MFKQMLTGAGSRFNGGNRWFDKTVQVISDIISCSCSCSFKSCPQFIQRRNIIGINERDSIESPSVGCFSRWSLRPLLRAFSQWGYCRHPIGNVLMLKDVLWCGGARDANWFFCVSSLKRKLRKSFKYWQVFKGEDLKCKDEDLKFNDLRLNQKVEI